MFRSPAVALLLLAGFLFSCTKRDAPGCDLPPAVDSCAGRVCTANFQYVTIDVTTQSGAPVALDSFVVTNALGASLPAVNGLKPYGSTGTPGTYALLTDLWVKDHPNQSVTVVGKGYLGGKQVVSQQATITSDCCHVSSSPMNQTVVIAAP